MYVFPQKNLQDIIDYAQHKNDDLGGVFEYLLNEKKQQIDYFSFDKGWYDIGSFVSYMNAHKYLQKNTKIQGNGCLVDSKSQLEGAVFLGEKTQIINSYIQDSIILNDCLIKNCVIRNSVIDHSSNLNNIDLTQKMIRAKSKIQN